MSLTGSQMAGIALVILLLIAGWVFLTLPDTRTTSEKIGDAIHDLDKGPGKAVRRLENRTPGEKAGDAVKDAGNSIKRATSNP